MRPSSYIAMVLIAVAVLIVPVTQSFCADVVTHVTTGQEKIKGQDIPGAKQAAVKKALEQAVQHTFASLVSRQTFASNLEFLYDRLLPGTLDFVVTYRVLDGIEYKEHYIAGVESKINVDLVEKRLKDARIIRQGSAKPVVLLLIAEQTPDSLLPKYWWGDNPDPYRSLAEEHLKMRLGQEKIPFAVSGSNYPDPSNYNVDFTSIYDAESAMALGLALKADMVVLGKAVAAESFNRMGDEKTFDATIELAAYDVASQTAVIHTLSKATAKSNMESAGVTAALNQAADQAAQDLGGKIDSFWGKSLRKENSFELSIEGENFLPRFIALKRRIQDIRDIENMQPKEIGAAHAIMEVVYKGSPNQFANAVMLKTFEGFGLEIAEVTEEQVKIRFVEDRGMPSVQEDEIQENPQQIDE